MGETYEVIVVVHYTRIPSRLGIFFVKEGKNGCHGNISSSIYVLIKLTSTA